MAAKGCSVVKICPPVPSAIPSIFFDGSCYLCRVLPPFRSAGLFTAPIRQLSERQQSGMKKPTEPYALAFSTDPNSIQTVVPVSRPDERQTVGADRETGFKCTRAMFVK